MKLKGCYVLLIRLEKDKTIRVGSLGLVHFKAGFYAYVGSGLNSLEPRIRRHITRAKNKRLRWHIDYLREKAKVMEVYYSQTLERKECAIAKHLSEHMENVKHFGSGDCKCESHLFHSKIRRKSEATIKEGFSKNRLRVFKFKEEGII